MSDRGKPYSRGTYRRISGLLRTVWSMTPKQRKLFEARVEKALGYSKKTPGGSFGPSETL